MPKINRKKRTGVLRIDPSRTRLLRQSFERDMRKRFRALKNAIQKLVAVDDVFGLRPTPPSGFGLVTHGGPGSGNFGHAGRPGEVGGSAPSSGEWLHDWTFGKEGKSRTKAPENPTEEVVKDFSSARPAEAVTLYRAHIKGAKHSSIESWTTEKGMAEVMVEDDLKRTLLQRRVHPSEILVDVSRLPNELQDFGLPGEVIVAHGKFAKEMAAFRGEKLTRGQLSNNAEYSFVLNDGPAPKGWQFRTSADKLTAFKRWVTDQTKKGILEVDTEGKPWTAKYIESSYKKGLIRSYMDVHKKELAQNPDFYAGSQQQFLESAFLQPTRMDQVKFLATRNYEELQGIDDAMSQKMGRVLAKGLVDGSGAEDLARKLSEEVDGIERTRARVLVRTEIVAAQAEGQLDGYQDLGVEDVGAEVEWSTAGDDHVCPYCLEMEGKIFSVPEARGKIPLHPNCRCAWMPVIDVPKEKKGEETQVEIVDSF